MSQIDKESLSALLDNEADDLELRRVLKACEQDPQLLETWARYSLVQSALHESAVPVSPSLSQRIAAQIEDEVLPARQRQTLDGSSWQQRMAKLAIAASVAVVCVFAVQSSLRSGPESGSAPAVAQVDGQQTEAQQSASQAVSLIAAEEVDPAAQQAAQQRLREYIESMTFDVEEPFPFQNIEDSSLLRMVNELQSKP